MRDRGGSSAPPLDAENNGGEAASKKPSRDGARNPPMTTHDHPPFFSSWRKAYWFAVLLFAIEVALLYAFTLRFS